ncbi:MAG: hypothetical protein ACRD6I_15525 [Candidatus Acidiferrales bacterium]
MNVLGDAVHRRPRSSSLHAQTLSARRRRRSAGERIDGAPSFCACRPGYRRERACAPLASETDGADGARSDAALEGVAYLDLAADAVDRGSFAGDSGVMRAASETWASLARRTLSADEYAQYRASSIAVLDDSTPAQLEAEANRCMASAPQE